MAKRTGANGARPEGDYQLFRVRKEAHRKAKAAANLAGVTLEEFASDAIERAADKVLAKQQR